MADANGQFTIRDVTPGQYTLEADQQGFFDIPGRQAIANVEAGKPANVSVPLLAGGTITGRVKNAAGKFLPNANVTAYQITYLNGKIIPQAQSSQATDDRGEYRMFWLPPGDYVVLVDPPTYPLSNPGNAPAIGGPRGGAPPQGPPPMSTPQFMRTFYPRSLTTTDAVVLAVKSGDQLSGMDITVQKATTYKISGEIHAAPSTGPVAAPRGRGANADPNAPQRIPVYLGLEYRDPSVIDMRSTNLGGTVPSAGTAILTTSADGLRATFEVSNVLPGQYYLVPRVTQNFATGSGIFNINRIAVDIDDKDVSRPRHRTRSQPERGWDADDRRPRARERHRQSRTQCGRQSFSNVPGRHGPCRHSEGGRRNVHDLEHSSDAVPRRDGCRSSRRICICPMSAWARSACSTRGSKSVRSPWRPFRSRFDPARQPLKGSCAMAPTSRFPTRRSW